jgi:hypothetical protein
MGREVRRILNNYESELDIRMETNSGNYIVKVVTTNNIETSKVFVR